MGNCTLIITEKPDAAQRIASALDAQGKARKMNDNGVPYYLAKRDNDLIVVPSIGHLYTVAGEEGKRNSYPVFNFKWVPRYVAEKNAKQTRKWIEVISKLASEADMFIDACDYDIEGSIIGYCILKYACNNKENVSRRMKYSTLTKEALEKSYREMLPHLDFAFIEAGMARHEVDWLYGINLSRALTIAAKNWSGQYATLSTGRVQGPTLRFIVAKEKTIKSFVPTPYWSVRAEVEINGSIFEAEYEKRIIETKREANSVINACRGKNGQIDKIDVKKFQQTPPAPFDLGALQSEAYRLFGYTPMRTSNIAQRLYLDALISYPRTSSQKLPPAIKYETILKNLNRVPEYTKLTAELLAQTELKPNEGRKEDPAHPAIYPTGNLPERTLDSAESNIWDLVVRRFMAVFGEPTLRQSMKVSINVNGHHFYLRGRQTLEEGWLRFYKPHSQTQEVLLPPMKEGQTIPIRKAISEDKFTKPSPRYNPGTLLERMEDAEIGTKATRAAIIQTLYDRNYVTDEKMTATDLGFEVFEILHNYCPTVISIKLTKELEEKMNRIQGNSEKRENVLTETVENLKLVVEKLKAKEKIIGEQLSNAVKKAKFEERTIGTCLICKKGHLVILYSRKTGKRFAGCTNYFKGTCKASYPLPQKGSVTTRDRNCHKCGWPTVQVRMKGKQSWTLCLNAKCPSKEKWRKKG
ncbi:DNA topoisomerase I [Candidatus Bathyarchaeota archaeon]|nr:DNA topoisomerase I [Candidatus Bathyarchaeota archaeon]